MSTQKLKLAKNLLRRNIRRKTRKIQRKNKIIISINDLQKESNELSNKIRNLEKRIRRRGINKHLKMQLKDQQGVLLRKFQKIKNKLKREKYKKDFVLASDEISTQEGRKSCVEKLNGEIHDNTCYLQTPFKSDCAPHERLIKNNPENSRTLDYYRFNEQKMTHDNHVILCPAEKILDKYGEDYEFVELVRSTRIADSKKPKLITVLFRFTTPQTGRVYKFDYSSRNGKVPNPPKPILNNRDKPSTWSRSSWNVPYGQEAWRNDITQRNIGKSNLKQKRFPQIKYERQLGGPYAKFKEKYKQTWPNMPLWDSIQSEINKLAFKLFSKDTIISIPSATAAKKTKKDKKFLIEDYKIAPIEWTGVLEKYEDIKNYFKNFPYKFIIIAEKKKLYVIVDVKLKGKLMSKKESENELARINYKRELLRAKNEQIENEVANAQQQVREAGDNKRKRRLALKKLDEALEKKRQFQQKNNINNNLSQINTGLTRNCDTHLEKIRDIMRQMVGYDSEDYGEYNAYERAKNNQLKVKFFNNENKMNE